jgi:hypothetical protein
MMATNEEILLALGHLQFEMAESRTDVQNLSKYVTGNGNPEDGVLFRLKSIEKATLDACSSIEANSTAIAENTKLMTSHTTDKKVHGLGWWKHKYMWIVGTIISTLLVAWFILYAIAEGNQDLLLKIIEAL